MDALRQNSTLLKLGLAPAGVGRLPDCIAAAIGRNSEALQAGRLVLPRMALPVPTVEMIQRCLWRSELVETFSDHDAVVAVPTGASEAAADATADFVEAGQHAEPVAKPQSPFIIREYCICCEGDDSFGDCPLCDNERYFEHE